MPTSSRSVRRRGGPAHALVWTLGLGAFERRLGGAFAAARTFVVLYVMRGLGQSNSASSAVPGTVAADYVVAAVVAGLLGDRFGLACGIYCTSFVYGGGFILGGLAQRWHDYF